MKRRGFGLMIIMGISLISFIGCPRVFESEDFDEPNEIQFYDYQLEYRRPAGSIVDIDAGDPLRVYFSYKHGNVKKSFHCKLTKQNDYLFTARLIKVPGNSSIEMSVVDPVRWKETIRYDSGLTWGNPHAAGDIFVLKCKQTGFEKELLKIVKSYNLALPLGYDSYMAQGTVEVNGSITDR